MKKYLVGVICLVGLLMTSCKANMPVAQQSGKEDVAYLLFVSQGGEYKNKEVLVDIDGATYTAKVIKQKSSDRRGTQYTCPTGNHILKVMFEGEVIYNKKVFLSTQQVKSVLLP